MGLVDDYLREVESTLRVENGRRRQIVDELRAHLHDKLDEERRLDPAAPTSELERRVLADFGSARDLALAYEPEGHAVLKNQAGEIVLRLGHAMGRGARAVGRGTGVFLKWLAIVMSVLLVLAIGLGVWAFYEVRPVVETLAQQSMPAYEYHETCNGTPCNGVAGNDRFFVENGTREVRLSVDVGPGYRDSANATGSVRIVVTDPEGNEALNRTFALGNRTSHSQEMRLAGTEGNWTVSVEYADFRGYVDLEAYAWSLGWRDI